MMIAIICILAVVLIGLFWWSNIQARKQREWREKKLDDMAAKRRRLAHKQREKSEED